MNYFDLMSLLESLRYQNIFVFPPFGFPSLMDALCSPTTVDVNSSKTS